MAPPSCVPPHVQAADRLQRQRVMGHQQHLLEAAPGPWLCPPGQRGALVATPPRGTAPPPAHHSRDTQQWGWSSPHWGCSPHPSAVLLVFKQNCDIKVGGTGSVPLLPQGRPLGWLGCLEMGWQRLPGPGDTGPWLTLWGQRGGLGCPQAGRPLAPLQTVHCSNKGYGELGSAESFLLPPPSPGCLGPPREGGT